MSLNTFFLSSQVLSDQSDEVFALMLDSDDFHHARVLRLNKGEKIAVVDADSDYFVCEIADVTKDEFFVRICERDSADRVDSKTPKVALFQGMPKGDKLETIIKQCTEIGIDSFCPFVAERSVSRPNDAKAQRKIERLQSIAKSAAMQSGRRNIPVVNALLSENEAINALADFDVVIVYWEECIDASLANVKIPSQNFKVAIVVGPEGGFSSEEISRFKSANPNTFVCSLGNTILRTETAAVVGCSLVVYEFGGLGKAAKSANAAGVTEAARPLRIAESLDLQNEDDC